MRTRETGKPPVVPSPCLKKEKSGFKSVVEDRVPWVPFGLLYPFLVVVSLCYGSLIRFRNYLYNHAILKSRSVDARVISVGNITTGGTGKTPLVRMIGEEAKRRGFRPGVVARGYKGRTKGEGLINDEGLMLLRAMPDLVLMQDPDRVAGARRAIEQKGADLLILDDGFQHRRLARDLNLLVIDATCPFGYGRILPAGLLREPLVGCRRADGVVLTRCDQVSSSDLSRVESTLAHYLEEVPFFRTEHVPLCVKRLDESQEEAPEILSGRRVFLFCAIANPSAFCTTVSSLGAEVKGQVVYPDHHWYKDGDIESIQRQADDAGAELVVTTSKDGAKLIELKSTEKIHVLEIGIRFQEGLDSFLNLVFS